ncbi:hypothetical protein, no similarity [Maudiozyma saulgeensis]|uniref:DUF1746 domain-containing protein n=1 Tax=Maudiozyma saulgeensis TaxID=1789683 RepID=A0A1X7R767_9SACH|nr:hypothetical protein, no similarity [Kazachstania saulgeensis]
MSLFTKHEYQHDLIKQLLIASQLIIFIRFIKDRSVLLACINLSILGIIMLISQIIDHQYELSNTTTNVLTSISHLSSEPDHIVVRNTVNKLMDNLQTMILFQMLYSNWYHWSITYQNPEIRYKTIFLFLIDDWFSLNSYPTLFSIVLDISLLIIQLIMINIQNNRIFVTNTETSNDHQDNQTVLAFLTNSYYDSYHHDSIISTTTREPTQEPLLQEHTDPPVANYGTTTS